MPRLSTALRWTVLLSIVSGLSGCAGCHRGSSSTAHVGSDSSSGSAGADSSAPHVGSDSSAAAAGSDSVAAAPPIDAVGTSTGCGHAGRPTGDLHLTAADGSGRVRDYELLVPASYAPDKPLAVVFVYHGAGGDQASAKGLGLQDAPGARDAAIFVIPQGVPFQNYGVGWDDNCSGADMPLFDRMLAAVEANYCVDSKRVFAAGFSWGGDQTVALACCRGDKLRAVAPASATDEYKDPKDYRTYNDLPCPVKGTPGVRFTHDASGGDPGYAAPLFDTTSALLRSFDGCASSSSPVAPAPCKRFDSCASPVIECPYPGLGHTIPPGWGADTWAFFASFR